MTETVDMVIVGGGPAGLAAGIRARQRGMSACILDPKQPPIDKGCGEGLMPAGLEALGELGVDVPRGAPIAGIRYRDGESPNWSAEAEFPQGSGRGVRRVDLHASMWDRAESLGVRWRREHVSDVVEEEEGVRAGGIRGRWLVAADGLHSAVRREIGLKSQEGARSRYGVRRHYGVEPWSDRVEVWWGEGLEAYITPVADDMIGVAILFGGDARFDELLERFPQLKERLPESRVRTEVQGGGPFWQRTSGKRAGRCLLVGDAAGYVDALTGEGVSVGVRTAIRAVDCIAEGRAADYETEYWWEAGPYLSATAGVLGLTRRREVHRPMIGFLRAYPSLFRRILGLIG